MGGVALGALSGVGFGLFQAVVRQVNAAIDAYRVTFGLVAVGTLLLGAIALLTEDVWLVARAPAGALLAFAAAGLVHFLLGWTFLGLSQQRIGATRTGALIATMPLFGTLGAAMAFGEVLGGRALLAVTAVVAGVTAVTLSGRAQRVREGTGSTAGVAFAFATAACWATSPLLIRLGLRGLASPLLGVTVGMAATTVVCGLLVVALGARGEHVDRTVLLGIVVAGTFVGLSIWGYWTAIDLAKVGVVLAVTQLSSPTVALVAPLLSGDPRERSGPWFWTGLALVIAGSVALLLGDT